MRFGYCINMIAPKPGEVGYETLPMLKEAGVDYVEMPLAQMMELGDEAFYAGPVRALRESGLSCLACNNFFPAFIKLTGPEADEGLILTYAEKALARAGGLGAKRVVFGSSGARSVPIGTSIVDGIDQLVALLPKLGGIAARYGITLVIEPLNPSESNLVHRFAHGLALAGRAAHPNVAALADYYHMVLSGDSVEELRYAGDRLGHLHIARPLGRTLPTVGDDAHYEDFFRVLGELHYEGTLSIEAYMRPEQGANDIAESLRYLRSLKSIQ